VRLATLLDAVVARAAPLAVECDVRVQVTVGAAAIEVDRMRLEQAVGNLLANAIGHGAHGARRRGGEGSSGPYLLRDILDRGPGLPDQVRERLFEPFQRGPNATGPGVGLGLATAAAAVRAHHGTISAEPREGGGTRFRLEIPLPEPER
jgi:two-component system OmpR family sensor kinase